MTTTTEPKPEARIKHLVRTYPVYVGALVLALLAIVAIPILATIGDEAEDAPYFRDDPEAMLKSYSPEEVEFVQEVKDIDWHPWYVGTPTVREMVKEGERACGIMEGEGRDYDLIFQKYFISQGRSVEEATLWTTIAAAADGTLC